MPRPGAVALRPPRCRRRALSAALRGGATAMTIRVLALASYPVEAASSRYRIVQFIAPLAERGIDVLFEPFLDRGLFAVLYEPKKLVPRLPRLFFRALDRVARPI